MYVCMVETEFKETETTFQMVPDKESLELTKNTKGYNWSIKLKGDLIDDKTLVRLDNLNKQMDAKYGNGDGRYTAQTN